MSNAICIQDQCQTFLMYNKVAAGDQSTPGDVAFVPYIKRICESDDGYIVTNYNLDGTAYTDTIEEEVNPVDLDYETVPVCVEGEQYLRWYVSSGGKPLGQAFVFHTTLGGELAEIADPASAMLGDCNAGAGCRTERLYHQVGGTLTPILRETCPGEDPVYYDVDGNELDPSELTGEMIFPGDVDVEQQVMCDGTASFVRWYVAVNGEPAFFHDTDLEGAAFAPAGPVAAGTCAPDAGCETLLYYAVNENSVMPYRVKFCPGAEPIFYDETNTEVPISEIEGEVVPAAGLNVEHHVMCDGEQSFFRWFVAINGQPLLSHDTDLSGSIIPTVTGDVTPGACSSAAEVCDSVSYLSFNGTTVRPFRIEYCPGAEPVIYDETNTVIELDDIEGSIVLAGDTDVKQQIMCGGETTFIRWFVTVNGGTAFFYDTDLHGAIIPRVEGEVAVGECKPCACCRTERVYHQEGGTLTPMSQQICPGQPPTYYDMDGDPVEPTGDIIFPEDMSVQQQFMCSDTTTFIRWYVTVRGTTSNTFYDTDLDGNALATPPLLEGLKPGVCANNGGGDDCECDPCEDCEPAVTMRRLCDIPGATDLNVDQFPRTTHVEAFGGTLPDGNEWQLYAWVSNSRLAFNEQYTMVWGFTQPTDMELTLRHRNLTRKCVHISEPIILKNPSDLIQYDPATGLLCIENAFGGDVEAQIVIQQTTGVIFGEGADTIWETSRVRLSDGSSSAEPVEFYERRSVGCAGAETITYVDADGNPYTVVGAISECPDDDPTP